MYGSPRWTREITAGVVGEECGGGEAGGPAPPTTASQTSSLHETSELWLQLVKNMV